MISPKLETMSGNYTDVVFLKVDVDETEDIAAEYGISAMPTFKFFKNGQPVS
jgi:thioredoxin 1